MEDTGTGVGGGRTGTRTTLSTVRSTPTRWSEPDPERRRSDGRLIWSLLGSFASKSEGAGETRAGCPVLLFVLLFWLFLLEKSGGCLGLFSRIPA